MDRLSGVKGARIKKWAAPQPDGSFVDWSAQYGPKSTTWLSNGMSMIQIENTEIDFLVAQLLAIKAEQEAGEYAD